MGNKGKKYIEDEFNWILKLQCKQNSMLKGKDDELSELFRTCESENQRRLLNELIEHFTYLNEDEYNNALNKIAKHICDLGYDADKTAIVAFCIDSKADSSQEIINHLKVTLSYHNDELNNTINNFNKIRKYYDKGFRHFIAVDEFAGSGKTLLNRKNLFNSWKLENVSLEFCLITAMEQTKNLALKEGFHLYATNFLKRGISDFYNGVNLEQHKNEMLSLESNLAETIGNTKLEDHSFGYGQAEALFARPLPHNIPNNVFPIFWWKKDKNNKKRKTLFHRVQNGY